MRQALNFLLPFSRVRRWWSGTDNQGQYFAKPGQLLLDIGCGSGLSLLEAKALGADVRGIEADPNVKRIADALGLKIHIGSLFDNPFPNEKYDLVILNQVIEHAPEPDLLLNALRFRLKNNARIVLVFPNLSSFWCKVFSDRWINWHLPYHLHHFTPDRFECMVNRLGFRFASVRTITPNLWTILQIRSSLMRVAPGQPSPVWHTASRDQSSPAVPRVFPRWSVQIFRVAIRRLLLSLIMLPVALINRIVDTFGLGDSVMVELVFSNTL
jgi:SAM-dependent methyltransferase